MNTPILTLMPPPRNIEPEDAQVLARRTMAAALHSYERVFYHGGVYLQDWDDLTSEEKRRAVNLVDRADYHLFLRLTRDVSGNVIDGE